MGKKIILAEGIIDVEKRPIICTTVNVDCDRKILIGLFRTETGATNVAEVERLIELHNGKNVRITLEVLDGDGE